MTRTIWRTSLSLAAILAGCGKSGSGDPAIQTVGRQPDVAPGMLNKELPFRYPPALFAQKVQGNVILRIFINREGAIVPESTHVAETSGFSALDSAAVKGSRELKFTPATIANSPVAVSILLPVFFRYPGAPPLPGDTVLKGAPVASSTASAIDSAAIRDSIAKAAEKSAATTTPKPSARKSRR